MKHYDNQSLRKQLLATYFSKFKSFRIGEGFGGLLETAY